METRWLITMAPTQILYLFEMHWTLRSSVQSERNDRSKVDGQKLEARALDECHFRWYKIDGYRDRKSGIKSFNFQPTKLKKPLV